MQIYIKNLWENFTGFVLIISGTVALFVLGPPFLIGYYHWLVWERLKSGNKRAAFAIFLFGCLVPDIALAFVIGKMIQGDW